MVLSGCRSSARIPPRLLALLLPYHQSGDEAATKRPATPSSLRMPSPDNAGPRTIGFKDEDIPGNMVPVQREHGVPETALRVTIRISRERVVYAATPTQFLKSGEHSDLITSRLAKPFDDQAANPKFAQTVIPGRLRPACAVRFGAGLHAMPRTAVAEWVHAYRAVAIPSRPLVHADAPQRPGALLSDRSVRSLPVRIPGGSPPRCRRQTERV